MIPCRAFILGMALLWVSGAMAQAPPLSPAERELQAPLNVEDGKPTQQVAQVKDEPSGLRALGSVLLVLGLAGGGLYAFRRWGAKRLPGSGGTRLKVEETLALGDRRFVSILRADGERFLIALAPQGVTLLSRLGDSGADVGAGFGQLLQEELALSHPMPIKAVEAMIQRGETS